VIRRMRDAPVFETLISGKDFRANKRKKALRAKAIERIRSARDAARAGSVPSIWIYPAASVNGIRDAMHAVAEAAKSFRSILLP